MRSLARLRALCAAGFAAALMAIPTPVHSQDPNVPKLSSEARQGGLHFLKSCAACHGFYAQGTKKGPPLLHPYYRPNHHSDQAFHAAIRNGARQHHWGFGDMKPVEDVADENIPLIIRYVRELQRANGVF